MTDLKDSPAKCLSCGGGKNSKRLCCYKHSDAEIKLVPKLSQPHWEGEMMTCLTCKNPWHDAAALPDSGEMPGQRQWEAMRKMVAALQALDLESDYYIDGRKRGALKAQLVEALSEGYDVMQSHRASAPSGNAGSLDAKEVAATAYQIIGALLEFLPIAPVRVLDYFVAIAQGGNATNPLPFSPDECKAGSQPADSGKSIAVCVYCHKSVPVPKTFPSTQCVCENCADSGKQPSEARREFEEWLKDFGPDFSLVLADPDCGTYAAMDTEDMYKAWMARDRALAPLRERAEKAEACNEAHVKLWKDDRERLQSELAALREQAEQQEAALEIAATESWLVKSAFMEIRDATELTPLREKWIADKISQWRTEAASYRDSGKAGS